MKLILEIILIVIVFLFFGPLILCLLGLVMGIIGSAVMIPVIYICALIDKAIAWIKQK